MLDYSLPSTSFFEAKRSSWSVYLIQRYNWTGPHQHNSFALLEIAEENSILCPGIVDYYCQPSSRALNLEGVQKIKGELQG